MQTTTSVSFGRLSPLTSEDLKSYRQSLLSASYDEEEGFGYRRVSLVDEYLSATLVKRTPTFVPFFNMHTGEITNREIFLYSQTEFALDAKFGLLEVFGASKNASKVRAALRSILRRDSRLQATLLAPADIIPKLAHGASSVEIERLTVNRFQYLEGVIGRYEMKIALSHLAHDLLKKYGHDVVRATIEVTLPDIGQVTIDLSSSGQVKFTCDEASVSKAILQVKSILFGDKE